MPVGANAGIAGLNVNVGVNLSRFDTGMRQVEQRGQQVTSTLNKLGSSLTTGAAIGAGFAVATSALTALGQASTGAVSAVVGLSSQLEQARIGFTAFTKDGEKANNFIKQLQQFAATTTFEFPGLLQGARQLMGMGVQAELVIPILKDVAGAVMAVGGGEEQIKGVNRALTQMMAAGKVNAQDMNQLAQNGIPAWKMLADSMGMTIGQVRKLSEEGKITAAQMLQAFHNFVQNNGLADMAEKAGQTWQAATSNIKDGLLIIATEGFSPLFEVIRNAAVALANFLTSDQAKLFAQDLKATIQDLVNAAAPLGEAFGRAFEAFKTGGVSGAFGSILTDVQNLARSMAGAGYDVVAEFVGGIMSGASSLVTEAANFVADTIASYLIGNSPPPVGPLSNIVQGGANVIAAYVDGMKSGLGDVASVAEGVADALGNVDKTLTLTQGAAALKAAGTDMKALQAAAEDAEGVLRNLDSLIRDNQSALRDYRNAADDIKTAYDAAVEPLQRQVDALKEVNDLAQKQADIQTRIQLAQLKGALQTAQGDPVQRARLQNQLEILDQQEKEISLQERQLSLSQQAASITSKAHIDEIKSAALKAKQAGDTEKATKLTQQAAALSLADNSHSQAGNQLAQRRLQLQQQQNQIQMQLNGMVDKEAVARIKGQQAQVQAVKDQRNINEEVANLNRELQAAPLEAQIKGLREQEQALIKPIQERIKETEREGQALQEQRQAWQGLKADISDVLQQQRALAAEAKKAATDAAKASKESALANPLDLASIFKPEAITAQATKVGESFTKGLGDWFQANGPKLIGGAVGSMLGGAAFGPLGAIAGAAFGTQFMARMQQNFGNLENLGGLIAGKISDALNIDTGKANNAVEAFGIIWETVQKRVSIAIEQLVIDIGKFLNIDISSGATVVDRLGIIWDTLKDRVATAVSAAVTEVARITGVDVSAANGPVDAIALLWDGLSTKVQGYITTAVEFIKTQWQSAVDAVNSAVFNENLKVIVDNLNTSFGILKQVAIDAAASILGLDFTPVESGANGAATKVTDLGTAIIGLTKTFAGLMTGVTNVLDFFVTLGSTLDNLQKMLNNTGIMLHDLVLAFVHLSTGDYDKALQDILGFQEAQKKAHEGQDAIVKGIQDFIKRVQDRNTAAAQAADSVGTAIGDGLTKAVIDSIPAAEQASTSLGQGVIDAMAATLQTGSPSVVMIEQGTFAGQGLAQGITDSTPLVVTAVTDEMALVLAAYDEGFIAVHAQTETQLTEIYTLMQQKFTDMVGLVPIMMQGMLAAFGTGFSAIHTQTGTQLGEIHALIMMEQEKWRAAGLALGTALGEGIAAAQLSVQRSGMSLMGNVVGGSKANPQLQATINAAANKYGLDPRLFTAQLQHESAGFDPNVLTGKRRGGSGEVGIGQFMPATLKGLGVDLDTYLKDINLQVETAAKYLSDLVKQYGDIDKALMAYNGGAGGVGSAATQRYAAIVHQVADTLQQETRANGGSTLMSLSSGRMNLGVDQITAGRQAGLSLDEARAICGPYAAVLFAQATGRNPTLAEAKELGAAVGWTAARGMGGTGNFMALLGRMGIDAVRQAATPENVNAALAAGNPIALSTPKHYFVGSGGTAAGGINVGATGTVMGGTPTMTLAEITRLGGGMNDLIVLTSKLNAAGSQAFGDLTRVSGQFGTAVVQDKESTQQMQATTQTLAASIQSGVVPAGLAARDAVGQMAIGIQPLISAWANGQMTSAQLAESIVQLSAQTGLATQPLASFAAGNMSVGEALRNVMVVLAQTDPAFAAIQSSMLGTQLSTEELADVLLRGLANVTGNVSMSLAQMATGAAPLQAAFASSAISGDQFVASVVELAATSGLTQAPLRQMQDGVLTANQALAQVISTTAEANPGLADMSTAFADLPAPATDAATAFLAYIQSLKDTQTATTEATASVEQVPDAVSAIESPMTDASTTVMQTLPDATTTALDSTVKAIENISGPAGDAARAVGQAIVDNISKTVEDGADAIAKSAQDIVEKALEAAKKAADAVKKSVDKGGSKGGGDADEKASGGRLTAGVWTLVGENGPELISPTGYVYDANKTAEMVADSIDYGLYTLETFASGGKSKSKSKTKSKSSNKSKSSGSDNAGSSTIKKIDIPKTGPELDLEEKVLRATLARSQALAEIAPIEAQIAWWTAQQNKIQKGSIEDQITLNRNKQITNSIDLAINKIMYEDRPLMTSMFTIQNRLNDAKKQQEAASKGDLATQWKLAELDMQRLQGEQRIAQIQVQAMPVRQQLADLEERIADIQKGSIDDQLAIQRLQAQRTINDKQANDIALQMAPLQSQAADLEADIARTLAGTVGQRKQLADNAQRLAELDVQTLQNQRALLPIQESIRKTQQTIEDAQRGTLDDQYREVANATTLARLRLQEISINGKLRDINAGMLRLSQSEINALHEQLEVIEVQKSQVQDTTEIRQLQAQINTTDAQNSLIALQDQERGHQDIAAGLDYEHQLIQNSTDSIGAQNALSVAGQQAKLDELNLQIGVYQAQITQLQAQNAVLDAQVQSIQLGNQIRANALGAELISLQAQVGFYDQMIGRVQRENDLVGAQTALINANNAVAAAGYNSQILSLQSMLDKRQQEIDQLQVQRLWINAQTDAITLQNAIAAAGHTEQIIRLTGMEQMQQDIVTDLNAQLGTLNAQKKVYEDIRALADAIANRPPNPPPTTGSPTGGPPGTVAATATKEGEQTLYLSRGTGTDGWYTSSGALVVQGGTSSPPSGYRVKWLAAGGMWHKGEVAVLGENGPEIAIAPQDLQVFPHEQSARLARAFGGRHGNRSTGIGDLGSGGSDSGDGGRNVTVNVEYHRHSGTDYGEGTLTQVVREAVQVALRS